MSTTISPVGNPQATEPAAEPGRVPLTYVPMSESVLPELDLTQRPWPGEEIGVDGMRLHVRRTPGPDGGAPAVYVHGLGGSATNWTDLAAQLAGNAGGYAVDLPGFGRTEPAVGYPFTLDAQADAVRRLIEHVGAPVHLLGNSMGGSTSMIVAARHPELVRTLTLISPGVPDLRPDPRRMSDPRMALTFLPVLGRPARRSLAAASPRTRAEQIMRLCMAEVDRVRPHRLDEAAVEAEERMNQPWASGALERATVGLLRAWLRFGPDSMWRLLPRIDVPTLVVWGTEDRLVSVRKAEKTARLLPRGRLLVLPRTGHVAQIERPVSVARAVLGMWEAVRAGRW